MNVRLFLMVGCVAGMCAACTHKGAVSNADNQAVVHTLILEADSLMRSDSLFWNVPVDRAHPRVCIHDSLIREKLDSAISLCPDKQTYLLKYTYLLRSWRLPEVLSLLREMDACMRDSMSPELWNMKAMLEDYQGDSVVARKDFLRADSAYGVKVQEVGQDSLMYGFVRLEKAFNLTLMKNDFRVLQEEITFYERVSGKAVHGMEQWKNLTDKREYYRQVFGQPE
jgi:hypothetical protein